MPPEFFDLTDGNDNVQLQPGALQGRTLRGLAGNDSVWGSRDAEDMNGNLGNDWLRGNDGNDTLRGGQGNDLLQGEGGNDTLFGNRDQDTLEGGDGDDGLFGGQGDDILMGGPGNDTLFGDFGRDTLEGGPGADIFMLQQGFDPVTGQSRGPNRILDFDPAQGDRLGLADGLTTGLVTVQAGVGGTEIRYLPTNEVLAFVDNRSANEMALALGVAPPAPTAPGNLVATVVGPTQINLTWSDRSDNETGFRIERAVSTSSNFVLLTTTAANTTVFADGTATPNTQYTYRVIATNQGSDGPAATVTATTVPSTVDVGVEGTPTAGDPVNATVVVPAGGYLVTPVRNDLANLWNATARLNVAQGFVELQIRPNNNNANDVVTFQLPRNSGVRFGEASRTVPETTGVLRVPLVFDQSGFDRFTLTLTGEGLTAEDTLVVGQGTTLTVGGQLSQINRQDVYQLVVRDRLNQLQVNLVGLAADADVQLLNGAGTVLASDRRGGTASERLQVTNLSAGDYFLQVLLAADTGTGYLLGIQTQ